MNADSLSQQFYKVTSLMTTEMLHKLGEDHAITQVISHNIKTSLSRKNPWRQRCIRDHQNFNVIAQQGKVIDDVIKQQEKDIVQVKENINQIDSKIQKLETDIDKSVNFIQNLNNQSLSIGFQIQSLQNDISRLIQYRERLGFQIQQYQNAYDTNYGYCKVEVPSDFFVDLHMHHERVIAQFQQKIDEAENIASILLEKAMNSEDKSESKE